MTEQTALAMQRVEEELMELVTRITRLKCFVLNNTGNLNNGEIYLMRKQLEVMEEYKDILKARLAIWRDIK